MSDLWDWTLTYRGQSTRPKCASSQGLLPEFDKAATAGESASKAGTVIGAITAIGQEIALACGTNPTKIAGSKRLLPQLSQILDGWRKEDPPTTKQLPVEADVPELLAERGRDGNASNLDRAIRDLTLIAFYYLLRIGEYTIKGKRNETKQTVQFKYEDVTFFKKNSSGQLRCLSRHAPAYLIATADGATMKLDNQKNG